MPIPKLTNEIIIAAIRGFEEQKHNIDTQIADLRALLSGESPESSVPEPIQPPRRKMSAVGRRAIAVAQRKRWAALKGQAGPTAPKTSKPKRKLSAAGKAAIVAALKKRWAAKRAEAKK